MKIFILLIFLGALSLAVAVTSKEQSCLNVTAKEKFEAKKFFKGTWYLTNLPLTSATFPTDVCRYSTNDLLEDDTVIHNVYFYSDKSKPEFSIMNCVIQLKDVDDHGKVPLQCKRQNDDKVTEFVLEVTVLETDYDHFAVYYVCGKTIGRSHIIILNRDKDGESTDPRIAESLKKQGLDLNMFMSRKNVKCKEHPDTISN